MSYPETATSLFLRSLLERCIGTVMIEPEQWDFRTSPFDRGYFNDRLKRSDSINALTHKRLIFIFTHLFNPENRNGRFQEPQAVEASNALISLLKEYFEVDFSCWKNSHVGDNSASRTHLLTCLDTVLALCEKTEELPIKQIQHKLQQYLEETENSPSLPANNFPDFLNAAPYAQTECFVGRSNLVSSVIETILSEGAAYLYGIGGIGKTEIAKAVVKKISDMSIQESGIRSILWITYTDGSFAQSLVRAMGLDNASHNLEHSFQKAVQIINQYRDQILLVIDNVETAEDNDLIKISSYLHCRILITSRIDDFHSIHRIPVPSLSPENCMTLFYHYYHSQHDDISLRKIIELADRHTVTIELLAKLADTEELLLHELLEKLIHCGFDLSEEEVNTSHEKLRSDATIIRQMQKLFQIFGCTEDELLLLMQISAIPSLPFSFEQAKKWFSIRNRTVLNRLVKLGWIKKENCYDAGRCSYHYVILSVIASAVRTQCRNRLYEVCHGFIRQITIEMQESRSQNDAAKIGLVQFSWSLNDIFNGQFHQEQDCDFLWALSEIYKDIGYYERTLYLLDLLKKLYADIYGESCIQLASVWNSYGMIYFEISRFNDALDAYESSHSILDNYIDSDNPTSLQKVELAKLEVNIGKTYLKSDYTKAAPYFDRAYAAFSEELGENDHLTLTALGNKVMLTAHTGRLEEAESAFLDIYNRIADEKTDRDILLLRAGLSHNLGSLYCDYNPAKAMPLLTEAKEIFWELLSPTHPDTLDVLNTICSLKMTQGENYTELLDEFKRLLALFIKAYGENDPNTGTIYNNIGLCYYYLNQQKDAILNYQKALRIDELSYGSEHEHTAYIHNNIGAAYSENDQPEKAISEHELALKIYEKAYPDHLNLDLAQTYADLADANLRLGNTERVMEYLSEAFSIYERMIPENSFQYITPYCTLANLLVALEDYDNAVTNYSHILWLLLENGYAETSDTVQEFALRITEVKQMAAG